MEKEKEAELEPQTSEEKAIVCRLKTVGGEKKNEEQIVLPRKESYTKR